MRRTDADSFGKDSGASVASEPKQKRKQRKKSGVGSSTKRAKAGNDLQSHESEEEMQSMRTLAERGNYKLQKVNTRLYCEIR